MKLQRTWLAVTCLIMLALQSCEKDVKNFDASATSHLVATSFISPQDTALTVKLQRTQPAIGKRLMPEELRVENAAVTLSDGIATENLVYNFEHDMYYVAATALAIQPNKTYFLKVTTPRGEKAEAYCTVPSTEGIAIQDFDITSMHTDNYGYPTLEHKLVYSWQDPSGTDNYYRASAYLVHYARHIHDGSIAIDPATGLPYKVPSLPNTYNLGRELMTDSKSNGHAMSSGDILIQTSYEYSRPPFFYHAILSVADKHYHLYHKSIYDQQQSDGNPFAEPTLIYSNIVGGLGVFAAYNQVTALKTVE